MFALGIYMKQEGWRGNIFYIACVTIPFFTYFKALWCFAFILPLKDFVVVVSLLEFQLEWKVVMSPKMIENLVKKLVQKKNCLKMALSCPFSINHYQLSPPSITRFPWGELQTFSTLYFMYRPHLFTFKSVLIM